MTTKKSSPLILVSVFLLIIIFAIVGYTAWQRQMSYQITVVPNNLMPSTPIPSLPTPTYAPITPAVSLANLHWVTYTNKHLGVTFQYPDNYATIRENQNTTYLISGLSYVFSVNRIDTSLTPVAWWESGAAERQKSGAPADQYLLSNVTFKHIPAVYFKGNFMAQVPEDFYAIQRGGFITTINFETEGTESVQIGPSPNAQTIHLYQEGVKQFRSYDKIIIQKILDSVVLN